MAELRAAGITAGRVRGALSDLVTALLYDGDVDSALTEARYVLGEQLQAPPSPLKAAAKPDIQEWAHRLLDFISQAQRLNRADLNERQFADFCHLLYDLLGFPGRSPSKATDGPGEEDGPWAEGWDKRSGRCTCEHADRYHFDDGAGFVRCRAADCKCNWPTSVEITEHIERDKLAHERPASGEPTDAEKRAMGVDLDSRDHEAR